MMSGAEPGDLDAITKADEDAWAGERRRFLIYR